MDTPARIPRNQWAEFVRGQDGEPIAKLISDLEDFQGFTYDDITVAIDAAATAAAAAAADAALVAARLNADPFLTIGATPDLPQSRQLLASGPRLTLTDAGAGTNATIALADQNVTLPADVSDNTGGFVDATGLVGTLAINSVYMVEGLLTFRSANVAVGIGLTFSLPAGATLSGSYNHNVTTTTVQGAYNNAAGAVSANTTAVPVANDNLPIHGRWIIRTGATAGNAQLRLRTSGAGTAVTLKQDLSILVFQKIG